MQEIVSSVTPVIFPLALPAYLDRQKRNIPKTVIIVELTLLFDAPFIFYLSGESALKQAQAILSVGHQPLCRKVFF